MSKIAIQLNDDRSIVGYASELTAEQQSKYEGWILVDSNPDFSVSEEYLWTIRQSDNKLVYVATGMTPDEQSLKANALLGVNVGKALAQANTASETANNALNIANKSVEANAQIGKLIAPLLAAQTTNNGGTN